MKHTFELSCRAGQRHQLQVELKRLQVLRRQRVRMAGIADQVAQRLTRMIRVRHQRLALT